MNAHPTRLEAARRLLELVREMSHRLSEERGPVRACDLSEPERKVAYFALVAGMLNPPIEPLAYYRDGDRPKHGPTVNGVVLRAAPQPSNWPVLQCRHPELEYVCGYRTHDPQSTHTAGCCDIRLGSIYQVDGKPPVVDAAGDVLDEPTKHYIGKTLRRWERFLENELLPKLTADAAAPAATTDDGAPEQALRPTPDGLDGAAVSKQHDAPAKLRPCFLKAKHWHDWGMKNIEGAEYMDYSQLHYALSMDSRCGGEGLPDNSAAFARYCNAAGVQKNSPRAGRKESLPRITDL